MGGGGGNEWRGTQFDVETGLGRRWLWCGIHGTERAVDSVRAPTVCVRAEGVSCAVLPRASG